jgi:hypothetical protein
LCALVIKLRGIVKSVLDLTHLSLNYFRNTSSSHCCDVTAATAQLLALLRRPPFIQQLLYIHNISVPIHQAISNPIALKSDLPSNVGNMAAHEFPHGLRTILIRPTRPSVAQLKAP